MCQTILQRLEIKYADMSGDTLQAKETFLEKWKH